ncbi:MAG: hypothetical protein CMQ23_03435 [Gammaproteobacteria bacterium]|nr:hypothetical protein [Gammaproteobacteria bacterium]
MAKLNHTPLSTRPGSLKGLWFLLGLMALLTSCATTEIVTTTSEPAMVAQVPIEDALRLDVMILPFDPNLERIETVDSDIPISAEVRRAESRYQAYHLKETLEQTGNWGVVRVIPSPTNFQPLLVQAKILASDGENLRLFVKATDAAGSVWINKEYSDSASKYAYQSVREDPFQDIYNQVANDLLKAHQARNAPSIINIQNVARLKFAADLSPESVSSYLQTDRRGRVTVTQLPAENDLVMQRVGRLRDQENLFVDTMDDYYLNFYRNVKPSYDEWRYATYDEAVRLRQMQKQARNRLLAGAALIAGGVYAGSQSETWAGDAAAAGAVVGGIGAVKSGMDRYKQAEIHEQALAELTQSLGMEIEPNVLQIEGQSIELEGTLDAQYGQWRRILKEIYAADQGNQ